MKYLMPRVYKGLLKEAAQLFKRAEEYLAEKDIKKSSDMTMAFLKLLENLFAKAGVVKISNKLALKEDEPRGYPSSTHYNEFVDAVETDIESVYSQSYDVDVSRKTFYNYMKANIKSYESLIQKIGSAVSDIGMISMRGDTKKWTYFREEFNSPIGTAANTKISQGRLKLGSSTTNDILVLDNIKNVTSSCIIDGAPGMLPYYGKKYGLLDPTTDDSVRISIASNNWMETTLSNLFDDPTANPDSFWEAEYVFREDTISAAKDNYGALEILRGAGEIKTSKESKLSNIEGSKEIYIYKNGYLIYQLPSQQSSFFRGADGEIIPRKMIATLTIELKDPQVMNSISITRKSLYDSGVDTKHTIYVGKIETSDGGSYQPIPQFADKSNNYIVTASTTKSTTGLTGNPPTDTVDGLSLRQKSLIYKAEAIARGDYVAAAVSEQLFPDQLNVSSSKYGADDVWTFPTRFGVRSIRITLFVDQPYQLRYAMERYKVLVSTQWERWFGGADTHWIFLQPTANNAKSSMVQTAGKATGASKNQVGPVGVSNKELAVMTASTLLGPWVALATVGVNALLHFGKRVKIDTTPTSKITLDPVQSDLYRWSVELSDISATGEDYANNGTYTSPIYESPKPIDRISLFSSHSYNSGNIRYFIEPIGSSRQYAIQPMEEEGEVYEDDQSDVPKILYVGVASEEQDTWNWGRGAYIDTPFTSFRVIIAVERGSDKNRSPEVESYAIKIKYKDEGGKVVVN